MLTYISLSWNSPKGRNEVHLACPIFLMPSLLQALGQRQVDCLKNLERSWPDLKMSEVREVEETKITPMFPAQVNATALQCIWKGEEGELILGDAEFPVLGDSLETDTLEWRTWESPMSPPVVRNVSYKLEWKLESFKQFWCLAPPPRPIESLGSLHSTGIFLEIWGSSDMQPGPITVAVDGNWRCCGEWKRKGTWDRASRNPSFKDRKGRVARDGSSYRRSSWRDRRKIQSMGHRRTGKRPSQGRKLKLLSVWWQHGIKGKMKRIHWFTDKMFTGEPRENCRSR